MSVILSTVSTSKASKNRVTFFLPRLQKFFFIFRIKNAFLTFFYFFPNVYYNYAEKGVPDGFFLYIEYT